MVDDLHARMASAAGDGRDRPSVDDLWARGRAARRRSRLVRIGAVAAVLVVLVGGAVALASRNGDDEGVMAGSGESTPPAEPTDGPVGLTVVGVGEVEGTPVLEAGGPFEVELSGSDEWMRGIGFTWQSWDGSGWGTTHTLVAALSGVDAGIAQVGGEVFIPTVGKVGPGSERLRAPDVGPGWYRVCSDLTGPPRDGSSTTEPADEGTATSTEVGSGTVDPAVAEVGGGPQTATACGQARILPADEVSASTSTEVEPTTSTVEPTTTLAPPPGEPTDGPVGVVVVTMPEDPDGVVHQGDAFAIAFDVREGDQADWTRGVAASWEAWDGRSWTKTHDLTVDPWPDAEPVPGAGPATEGAAVEDVGFTLELPAGLMAPRDADPGVHRVCIAVGRGDGVTLTPCAQVELR